MDIYHVWCDLKPSVKDTDFTRAMAAFMGHLEERGAIEGWRLTRRKLGLAPKGFGEFHIMIETRALAQLDEAFGLTAERREPTESVHHGGNSLACNLTFALYRDFPDRHRHEGEERF